jgi:hypothetical protein
MPVVVIVIWVAVVITLIIHGRNKHAGSKSDRT